MNDSVRSLKERLYDGRPEWVDGTTRFARLVSERIQPPMLLLDLGAGAGKPGPANFLGEGVRIIGLDPNESISCNTSVSMRVRGLAQALPFTAAAFDLVFADWVIEHLDQPSCFAREVARVLRSGGFFVFRTGNLWHYSYAIAAHTPQWFHNLVANRVRGLSDSGHEPYPTFYMMNTLRAVRRTLLTAGFVEEKLTIIETEPSYLMFSTFTFLAGLLYERIVNSSPAFEGLRSSILACYRKI